MSKLSFSVNIRQTDNQEYRVELLIKNMTHKLHEQPHWASLINIF